MHHGTPAIHLPAEISSLPPIAAIVVGLLLLFFGRKLFWLFVGATGFVVGMEFAATFFPQQGDLAVIVGLILGLISAVAAIFVQKIAIGIAGFLAGGYFLMTLSRTWELQTHDAAWIAFIVGGIIGTLLMYIVFSWALIILSSISGAQLIVHPFALKHDVAAIAFVVIAMIGILAQGKIMGSSKPQPA